MTDRLVLGTAQFGMLYGINNKIGKPDFAHVLDTVKAAFDHGITRFDTAQAYGDSEVFLGRAFDELGINTKVGVYTKLSSSLDLRNLPLLQRSVDESLRRLKVDCLEGLLFHHEKGLDQWNDELSSAMRSLVTQGKVRVTGASFYSAQKANQALDLEAIDIIQVPANIFDRRFEDAGVFLKAHELKKQVFVRSIFLQGLLLIPIEKIPPRIRFASEFVQKFIYLSRELNVNRQELAMGYVKRRYQDAFFVIGAEDATQVSEISMIFKNAKKVDVLDSLFDGIPENVLNPSLWPQI